MTSLKPSNTVSTGEFSLLLLLELLHATKPEGFSGLFTPYVRPMTPLFGDTWRAVPHIGMALGRKRKECGGLQ